MALGTVKWFNPRRGYGFINLDESSDDVFVHAKEVVGASFRNELFENQRVEFEVVEGEKGLAARNVRVVE